MMNEICDNIKTAIEHGRTDIIKSLLEACDEEDPDQNVTKDRILNQPLLEEGTFLCLATKLHRGDVVRTLLSCGADPGVQNDRGMNAVDTATGSPTMRHIYVEELLRATANSEVGRVCQLLAAGVGVNERDSEGGGNAPLHWAACYGGRDVVACLLDRGADVNAMNAFGATPLHDAMFRGDEDVVEMLLQAGANPLIQAIKGKFAGKTPLDMATQKRALKELVDRFVPLSLSPVESPLPASVGVNGFSQPMESETEADSSGQERSKSADSSGSGGGAAGAAEPARTPVRGKVAAVHRRSIRLPRPAHLPHSFIPPHPTPLPLSHPSLSSAASTLSLELGPHIDRATESLLRSHAGTGPVRPLVTHPALHLLWPQPASILELEGAPFVPCKDLGISVVQGPVSVHRILDVWEVSRPRFLAMGYDARIGDVQPSCGSWTGQRVECLVNPELFASADSYQIHVSSEKVQLQAGGLAGLHYALATFAQLVRLAGPEAQLPPVLVRDRPAVAHRGVLLDVSPQGRVPTLSALFLMVDLWSAMKVNFLHLYTRLVPSAEWQLCYSRSNVVSLDRYCRDRFVTVVPVLDVDNGVVYDDLADMWPSFQEILASFPDLRYVHIGPKLCSLLLPPADEGARGGGAAREGAAPARALWHLLSLPPSVTLMLCANSLRPAAPALPSNVVLVQYGFQADYNFVDAAQDWYARGVTTCLCPGTASWNSLAGCPEAAVCNTYRAARAAVSTGSLGVVVAHWSGSHHLTPHTFGWPGFLAGCGLAWNPDTHWDYMHNSLSDLLDAHVFLDPAGVTGAAVLGLGRAETYVTYAGREPEGSGGGAELADLPPQGGSTLYRLLTDPDNVALDCLSVDLFARVTKFIKKCQNMFFQAKPECENAEVVMREVQLSADLLLTACRIGRTLVAVGMNPNSNMGLAVINLGICNLPPTFRTDIANKMLAHIEQYKGAWLQSQLPAGLQASLLLLTSALHRFVPDEAPPP